MGQQQALGTGLGRQAAGFAGGEVARDLERIGRLQHQQIGAGGQRHQRVADIRIPRIDQGPAGSLNAKGQAALGVIGGRAFDHQAGLAHLIGGVRRQLVYVHEARRRYHPVAKGRLEPLMKPGKAPGGQEPERLGARVT